MAVNKVVYNGNTLIDLTEDTVSEDKLASGYTAHDKTGAVITGTNTFDADTSDATATAANILNAKTAYVNGNKITGTMANKGTVNTNLTTKEQVYTIAKGYHSGSGKVMISSDEQAKIIAGNIKQGVEILGVTGSLRPASDVKAQSKTVTPSNAKQTVIPDSGYDYLSQVIVNKISYVEEANSAGGTTVTIA